MVANMDLEYAYGYLDNEGDPNEDGSLLPIQSPNLKRHHKKMFSLEMIREMENEKISNVIKKRLK